MPLWKITEKGPARVRETKFKQEKLLEEHLEDWIASDSSILGEPLLVFGRQVIFPDVKDRLDLLALDQQGSVVVIELKRGALREPVDVQSLRYASYMSRWSFEDFENVARNYFGKVGNTDFNFIELFESFCSEQGIDDTPDINTDQRIIIVGASVREKLGSVALWLRDHNIDIKLIEVQAYKEGNDLFIEPATIVPLAVSRFGSVGKSLPDGRAWTVDGKAWHLGKRCSPKTKQMLLALDQVLQDELDIDGPRWNQKYYVAYPVNNYNWMRVITRSRILVLDLLVKAGTFELESLAKKLGVQIFDRDERLAEKLGLPSSVLVKNRNATSDRIKLRLKEDFDIRGDAFISFLKEAYKAFPK